MSLKLMYITKDCDVAKIAEKCEIQRIFVDLEQLGKADRQGHVDSVKSHHTVEDVGRIKDCLCTSQLLVRVNPINPGSSEEIDAVIQNGADIIMLPMWKSMEEVKLFLQYVNGRAKTMLLLETKEADSITEEVVQVPGIDEIHIGLNDLHLSYHKTFMFELMADGTVERLTKIFREAKIPFGIGGIAGLGEGLLPAEKVIAEHYRLQSSGAILSRSFCDTEKIRDLAEIERIFATGVKRIRDYEDFVAKQGDAFFQQNRQELCEVVARVTEILKEKRRG